AWFIFRWLRAMRRYFRCSARGVMGKQVILPFPLWGEGLGVRGESAPETMSLSLPSTILPFVKVSILIPFKDQLGLLRNCLHSLRRGTYRRLEIILLDNGSTSPALTRYLRRMRGRRGFQVVACPGPFNFAAICNRGAQHA